MVPERPRLFWLISAAYNGVGLAFLIAFAIEGEAWMAGLFCGVTWTTFMVLLGVIQTRQVARDVEPP